MCKPFGVCYSNCGGFTGFGMYLGPAEAAFSERLLDSPLVGRDILVLFEFLAKGRGGSETETAPALFYESSQVPPVELSFNKKFSLLVDIELVAPPPISVRLFR